jgi:hypothetical protein
MSFIGGVLTAEISPNSTNKIISYLKDRSLGRTFTLEYKSDGQEIKVEYRTPEELEQALKSIEKLLSISKQIEEENE